MEEIFMLVLGAAILVVVIYDFLFTTLSGSGAGFLTEINSIVSDKIIRSSAKLFGRKTYNFRGMVVNLIVLAIWILSIWIGLFLLYSSNPEAIVNSEGRIANVWERIYFSGYIISTLGMGNFIPTSAFFEIVTSLFSIFGFIFFTSSMTYFISVSSALVNKRTITKSITSLGTNPQEIFHQFLSFSPTYCLQQFVSLQAMIDRHSVNHHAYPVVHFFSRAKEEDSFSLNISRFDEALSILASSNDHKYHEDLKPLRNSLTNFLNNLDTKFSSSLPEANDKGDFPSLPYDDIRGLKDSTQNRRRILERILKSEGYTINDIRKV